METINKDKKLAKLAFKAQKCSTRKKAKKILKKANKLHVELSQTTKVSNDP